LLSLSHLAETSSNGRLHALEGYPHPYSPKQNVAGRSPSSPSSRYVRSCSRLWIISSTSAGRARKTSDMISLAVSSSNCFVLVLLDGTSLSLVSRAISCVRLQNDLSFRHLWISFCSALRWYFQHLIKAEYPVGQRSHLLQMGV